MDPFITRLMPSFNKALLKLINKPSERLVNLRYVKTCMLCTGARAAMDLISIKTLLSTIRSALNP